MESTIAWWPEYNPNFRLEEQRATTVVVMSYILYANRGGNIEKKLSEVTFRASYLVSKRTVLVYVSCFFRTLLSISKDDMTRTPCYRKNVS